MAVAMPTRRNAILATAGIAAGLTALPSRAGTPLLASGAVFHDRNGGGVRRPGDPGIEGVLVSNGCEVVRTDAAGRWLLPTQPGSQIFVIKPPNWSLVKGHCRGFARRVPSDGDNGSPSAIRDLDFGLIPTPESTTFDAVLIADTQPASEQELGYLRDGALTEIANTGAAFAINHGDVVFDNPALYAPYLQLTAATGMPWHHCPGNHDMNAIACASDNCFETFEAILGPVYYAFQYGAAVFFILNNIERLRPGLSTTSGYDYRGALGRRQLGFVRNVLAHIPQETLVVISAHIPLVGFEDPTDPAGHTTDAAHLMTLLSGRPHTVSFAGHTHTTEHHYIGDELGFNGPGKHHHHVLTTASGSWWSGPYDHRGLPLALSRDGSPKGFHLLRVEGNRYTTELVPVGHAGHLQASIAVVDTGLRNDVTPLPAQSERMLVTRPAGHTRYLVVNVFDGGPQTRVVATIDGEGEAPGVSRPLELSRKIAVDPSIVEHYRRNQAVLKPWVGPSLSSHLWTLPLPDRLSAGVRRIEITITNEYGHMRHISSLLVVRDEAPS
jgi:C terminal of Calcineurin-like phosphoesterase/Calcineurin-like phosphoesterase